MRKKITVTKDDIREGVYFQLSNSLCPVARAMSRAFPKSKVRVGATMCNVDGVSYELPIRANKFISKMLTPGQRRNLRPFSFFFNTDGHFGSAAGCALTDHA